MDLVVLRHLVAELSPAVRGARIDQVYALPRQDLALVLGLPGSPRLWFSSESDEPHLYLRPDGQPAPKRPPGFAMALRKRARGRRIADLRLINDDRVVELSWHGDGSRLVMELVTRRASAFVVDPDDRVVAVWSPRRGRPDPGEAYRPPTARAPRVRVTDLDYSRLDELPDSQLRRELVRQAEGMTPLLAREIIARRASGLALREAAQLECARAGTEPTAAHLYSVTPLDRLDSLPAPDALVLAPYELASGQQTMRVAQFPTLSAARSPAFARPGSPRGEAAAQSTVSTPRARCGSPRDRATRRADLRGLTPPG